MSSPAKVPCRIYIAICCSILMSCARSGQLAPSPASDIQVLFWTNSIVNEYTVVVGMDAAGDYLAILTKVEAEPDSLLCESLERFKSYSLVMHRIESPAATSKKMWFGNKAPESFSTTKPYNRTTEALDSIVVIWDEPEFRVPVYTSPQIVGGAYCPCVE